MDLLPNCICCFRGDSILWWQHSDYLCPETSLTGLLELVAYFVDYPVWEQAEEELGVSPVVFLVVYMTQIQVGDEMYQRSVYLYLAPALSPEESVYLNLPDCQQTYPFGAYICASNSRIHKFVISKLIHR